MPCKDCVHKGVCTYKEDYEIFLKETLRDAFDMMPQNCDMHVDCKAYMPAEEIAQCDLREQIGMKYLVECAYPLTVHEETSFKAFYKKFYNYDWHNVEIYIYPKC